MLGINWSRINWGRIANASTAFLLMVLFLLTVIAPPGALAARTKKAAPDAAKSEKAAGKLTEVAPPGAIQNLRPALDGYQPQVFILSPKPNQILEDDKVSVQFQVKDLPIFKDATLGLGTHLHVLLDNQTYQAVYDTTKPLTFDNLAPGTHTIRVFASRPWHESFKNEGAYAQTTFHIFTKTQDNSPSSDLPLLTYSRPQGTYGAEPIMLDFYLTNAPLHLIARETKKDDIADWRIRCTVNGSSFILDQWQPIYLKGFKPGKNWVQLEFLDENGDLVKNTFNNTVRVINYEPGGTDTLSKLVRGEILATDAQGLVEPNYTPPAPMRSPSAEPVAPIAKPTPTPIQTPVPQSKAPKEVVKPSPTPSPTPLLVTPSTAPTVKPTPSPEPKLILKDSTQSNPANPDRSTSPIEPSTTVEPRLIAPEPPVKLKASESTQSTGTEATRSPLLPKDAVEQKDERSPLSEKTDKLKSGFMSQLNQLRQRLRRDTTAHTNPQTSSSSKVPLTETPSLMEQKSEQPEVPAQ
ncbi:hypothetical protein JOY44_02565 [Phormidium sp. CLA17]|uniref:hypothetical protein n=1 Tax=Leptolyngbya sp. Cla-17 TaxID=2803751 RepID=UPI001492E347|nr:hypothetical protein [Leptolyngbya sp. Cla-17]MBM0740509.1 hypothetical protein [Leptolyngbya sp. Cla-17]